MKKSRFRFLGAHSVTITLSYIISIIFFSIAVYNFYKNDPLPLVYQICFFVSFIFAYIGTAYIKTYWELTKTCLTYKNPLFFSSKKIIFKDAISYQLYKETSYEALGDKQKKFLVGSYLELATNIYLKLTIKRDKGKDIKFYSDVDDRLTNFIHDRMRYHNIPLSN